MSEKETVFSSSMKYSGIFSFKDFYKFCYDWLSEETGLGLAEEKYEEKIKGDEKDISIDWSGSKKITDYFKSEIKVSFSVSGLKGVEVTEGGKKIKTNTGGVKIGVKGVLVRDYEGKFETTPFQKFLRGVYEKWVIPSRIEHFEEKIFGDCDDFIEQAKAYLALEGKK